MENKWKIKTCFFILLYSFFISNKGLAQYIKKGESDIECKAIVQSIDSEYLLLVKLLVHPPIKGVRVHKILTYGIGNCNSSGYDCRFFLQKIVRNTLMNISVDHLNGSLVYDSSISYQDYSALKEISYKDSLVISPIHLGIYYPLEIGTYRLRIEMDYYYNKKKYTASSDWCMFDVGFIPIKNSL